MSSTMQEDLVHAVGTYINGTNTQRLTEWFRRVASDDPDKFRIAYMITHRPIHSVPLDLPFIRHYLYRLTNLDSDLTEKEFNEIVRIEKNAFYLSSGVTKIFGGDRNKNCGIIVKIIRELNEVGIAYKMSDQVRRCLDAADSLSGWVDLSQKAHSDGGVMLREDEDEDERERVSTAAEVSTMIHDGTLGGSIKKRKLK